MTKTLPLPLICFEVPSKLKEMDFLLLPPKTKIPCYLTPT